MAYLFFVNYNFLIALEDYSNIRAANPHITFDSFRHNTFLKVFTMCQSWKCSQDRGVLLSKRHDISYSETEYMASKGKGKTC